MEKFEEQLKTVLSNRVDGMVPSDDIKNKIDKELENHNMEQKTKHFSVRKTAVLVMAACLLLGMGVFASGTAIGGLISGFDAKTIGSKTTDFSKLEKEEEILGYQVKAVENFSTGFSFKQMDIDKTFGLDEDGNVLRNYAYYDLCMIYTKTGFDKTYINICKPIEKSSNKQPKDSRSSEQGTISYYEDTYKWVPAGYQPTEEDNINMQRDDYFISEGGDEEISESKVCSVNWMEGDISYSIMRYDLTVSKEELYRMAEEIMNSTK